MPRKPWSNAASSAAAAAKAATPTFTSFSAVTAQALGSFHGDGPSNGTGVITDWDNQSLSLLKKFSKRDANTRQRALADLSTLLTTLPKDGPDTGSAFLSAWATAFPSLILDDSSPAVRAAAVSFAATVIKTFGRATQPTLHVILPPWVSAIGDSSPIVSAAALDALESSFPAPDRKRKAAVRYDSHLRDFCSVAISSLSSKPRSDNSARYSSVTPSQVTAVLQWLLTASDDLSTITPIIDGPSDPLRILVLSKRDPKSKPSNGSTASAVVALSIDIVRRSAKVINFTNVCDSSGKNALRRLERIGLLAILLAKNADPAAWDLLLVLLRETPDIVLSIRDKLIDALASAAAAPSVPALSAVLPVVDSLTCSEKLIAKDETNAVLRRLLDPLRKLLLSEGSTASVAFTMTVLPFFLETLAFVHRVVVYRCFSDDERATFLSSWIELFTEPICRAIISGRVPFTVMAQSPNGDNGLTKVWRKTGLPSSRASSIIEISLSFGKLIRSISEDDVRQMSPHITSEVVLGMEARDGGGTLERMESLLDFTEDLPQESVLVGGIVSHLVSNFKSYNMQHIITLLAFVLRKRGASQICGTTMRNEKSLVDSLKGLGHEAVRTVGGDNLTDGFREFSKNLSVVYSWVIWAAQQSHTEEGMVQDVMDALSNTLTKNQKFVVTLDIADAHERRISSKHFSPCGPLKGIGIDLVVSEGLALLRDGEASPICIEFLSTVARPSGGADISGNVAIQIATALSSQLRIRPKSADFDSLIVSLLSRSFQNDDAYNGILNELMSASIYRAALSDQVLRSFLTHLSTAVSTTSASHSVNVIIEDLNSRFSTSDITDYPKLGTLLAKLVATLGERDIKFSVAASTGLLGNVPVPVLQAFLASVPFHFVFGEGSDVEVCVGELLEILRRAFDAQISDILPQIEDYFSRLEKGPLSLTASNLTDLLLEESSSVAWELTKCICSSQREKEYESIVFSAIAEHLNKSLQKSDCVDIRRLEAIPKLVYLCVVESKGSFIYHAKNLLTNATNIIRRDLAAPSGLISLDILSASFGNIRISGVSKVPAWWQDLMSIVLRSTRRCLEQSRGLTKIDVERLELHSACFVYHYIKGLGGAGIIVDDVRFWTLRTREVLEKVIQRLGSEGSSAISDGYERFAWIYNMGDALLDFVDMNDEGRIMLTDEISHWAAWSGVYSVPSVVKLYGNVGTAGNENEVGFVRAGAEGWASLTIRAAERGVLLGRQGEIPVNVRDIYALVPWLGSKSYDVRRAVLIVIAHGAALDLSSRVKETYPEDGFSEERAEREYAMNIIPREIREGLKWTDADRSVEELALAEMKLFLTWRLLFDLIAANDDSLRVSCDEEKSLRLVVITFLHDESHLLSDFFKRCVDVVVDGSKVEREAAALAAVDALTAADQEKQGIQLALENNTEVGVDEDLSADVKRINIGGGVNSLEQGVGQAAGAAFARAWRRVPALFRDFVWNRVDRGLLVRIEAFVRRRISPLLIAEEIRKVKEWGAFGGGVHTGHGSEADVHSEGELHAHGSVAGRDVRATYTFSDVTLEIGMQIPDVFPLRTAEVEARSHVGMSEARWRKTLLGMTTLLQARDGSLAEAVELWRRNLDKSFQGMEECPICYSILHLSTAATPRMQCRTCKKLFHSDCLCKWFTKSNSSACPLCRSAF